MADTKSALSPSAGGNVSRNQSMSNDNKAIGDKKGFAGAGSCKGFAGLGSCKVVN